MPTIYVLSKNKKNITNFHLKILFLQPWKIAIFYMGMFFRNVYDLLVVGGT